MTATTTALVPLQPAFSDAERLALAGFLARIPRADKRGIRAGPAPVHHLVPHPLPALVRRPPRRHRVLRRDLEAKGRARATVTRRLCTIAGFYKCAVEEELLDHSPAAHVRRPRPPFCTVSDDVELEAIAAQIRRLCAGAMRRAKIDYIASAFRESRVP